GKVVEFTNANLPSYLQGGGSICYPALITTIVNPNGPAPVLTGNIVTYRITTKNILSGGNAGGVKIQAKLPPGFNFHLASVTYNGYIGGPAPGAVSNLGTPNAPVFGDFNIPPGGEITLTMQALVTCGTPAGLHHASAQAVYLDPTRKAVLENGKHVDPFRLITAAVNAFPGTYTTYETGSVAVIPGSNYDGNISADEDVFVSGTECPEVSFEIDNSAVL